MHRLRTTSVLLLVLLSTAALRPAAAQVPPDPPTGDSPGAQADPPAGATAAPGAASASAAPALDLAALEQRLKDTSAIGLFTKLSLKNQVDDLVSQFRAFHSGSHTLTLGQLRKRFEVLLLKVVTLLQDDDPELASAVSSSREAIWSVLSDPKKFALI